MTAEIKLLQDLLDKYLVPRPIPAGIRRVILAHKRRNFVVIMKKVNRYNPLLGAFLFVYFLVRKFGIFATLKQCGIILITVSALTVAGVSSGAYIVIRHILYKPTASFDLQKGIDKEIKDDSLHKSNDKVIDQIDNNDTSPVFQDVKNIIAIQPFESMNTSTVETSLVSGTIQNELVHLRGGKNIRSSHDLTKDKSTRLLIIGTVRKMESVYDITAKIIDRESGKIHFAATEETKADTLITTSKKLAREISDNIE